MAIKLIAGLGNPGPEYASTRHNAGQWFVERVASKFDARLERETRFSGFVGRTSIDGNDVRLLVPSTYMNNSGVAVGALARFFHLATNEILVVHDEVAFEAGIARLKQGGGNNGHNGLADIVRALGNDSNFLRLRLGVGHPGDKSKVVGFLTGQRTPKAEREKIDDAIERSLAVLADVVAGNFAQAMNRLHSTA